MPFVRSVDPCGEGWVRVWEEGRYVCEPEEKTVAVFEAVCIDSIDKTENSRVLVDIDFQGKPDLNNWTTSGFKLKLKNNCAPHYEKVKR